MKKLNKTIGDYGEDIACKFLISKGYRIIEKNFRNRFGEIDLICLKNNILTFTEVKTRYYSNYGLPKEAVNFNKRKNIIFLSKFFISKNNFNDFFIRFDVIEIFLNINSDSYKINFIKDAFRVN
ncbi:YraN family protein [Clostridium thermobutyricum]|uniref:YraN family protein n=1 Tax=Clostridium thermobutyricum TaxID=29372 RepID=UPI0009AEAC03|nr:YraN family protein [Clostridium thermobutyricum]